MLQTIKIGKQISHQLDINGLFPNTLARRKKDFLNKLISPSGKTKYKRYMGAPIRYAGGKSLAVGLVIERNKYNIYYTKR